MSSTASKNTDPMVKFEIPAEGSLGLLALGAVGLRMWRKVRDEQREKGEQPSGNREGGTK